MTTIICEPEPASHAPAGQEPTGVPDEIGGRQIFVEQADAKMRHVRQGYRAAAEELAAIYRHVAFRLCDAQAKVGFLVKRAEARGALDDERRGLIESARATHLDALARTQQEATAQIKDVADRFAEREVGFGPFLAALARGGMALSLGAGSLAIDSARSVVVVVTLLVAALFLLALAIYLSSAFHRSLVARRQIRIIGQMARAQMDILTAQYVAGVRHVLS